MSWAQYTIQFLLDLIMLCSKNEMRVQLFEINKWIYFFFSRIFSCQVEEAPVTQSFQLCDAERRLSQSQQQNKHLKGAQN